MSKTHKGNAEIGNSSSQGKTDKRTGKISQVNLSGKQGKQQTNSSIMNQKNSIKGQGQKSDLVVPGVEGLSLKQRESKEKQERQPHKNVRIKKTIVPLHKQTVRRKDSLPENDKIGISGTNIMNMGGKEKMISNLKQNNISENLQYPVNDNFDNIPSESQTQNQNTNNNSDITIIDQTPPSSKIN